MALPGPGEYTHTDMHVDKFSDKQVKILNKSRMASDLKPFKQYNTEMSSYSYTINSVRKNPPI